MRTYLSANEFVIPAKILIVEDEMLVACEVDAVLGELGREVVGIASDMETALTVAMQQIDLALVDLNLRDGPTGPEIGKHLCARGDVAVFHVTANPRILYEGISGAIGVMTKPVVEASVRHAVDYALRVRAGDAAAVPPRSLRLFQQAA